MPCHIVSNRNLSEGPRKDRDTGPQPVSLHDCGPIGDDRAPFGGPGGVANSVTDGILQERRNRGFCGAGEDAASFAADGSPRVVQATGVRSMQREVFLPAAVLICGALAIVARGQQPPGVKELEVTGKIKSVAESRLEIETEKDGTWLVDIPSTTKVQVIGSAELAYLRPGMAVRFSGDIDKKGAVHSKIKELEVFLPQGKNGAGPVWR